MNEHEKLINDLRHIEMSNMNINHTEAAIIKQAIEALKQIKPEIDKNHNAQVWLSFTNNLMTSGVDCMSVCEIADILLGEYLKRYQQNE